MNKLFIPPLLSISIALGATWDGAHYQATCSPQFEMAQFAVSQLPEQAYGSILDIGCGSGDFTVLLSERASFVLGVDYSESMIRRAQESYGHHEKVAFQVADIRSLNGIERTFDLITCFHTIQWIAAEDQARAFDHMARLTAGGGTCLVLVSDHQNVFYKPLMETVQKPQWKQYMPAHLEPWNWQTVGSISRSFEHAGLRPMKVFIWYKKYYFDTKDGLYAFMKNWFFNAHHFDYVPQERRQKLFNDILENFLTRISYSGTGPVEFESPFVVGIAHK